MSRFSKAGEEEGVGVATLLLEAKPGKAGKATAEPRKLARAMPVNFILLVLGLLCRGS